MNGSWVISCLMVALLGGSPGPDHRESPDLADNRPLASNGPRLTRIRRIDADQTNLKSMASAFDKRRSLLKTWSPFPVYPRISARSASSAVDSSTAIIAVPLAQEAVDAVPRVPDAEDDAEQQRRQNTVTVGVLILVGVAAIGLLLIAGALIWGAKIRRMVRPTSAEPTRQDELWYLRKEKPSVDAATEPPGDPPRNSPSAPPRVSDSDETRS